MVADYTVKQENFDVGKPRVWSATPILRTGVNRNLDLHPDGKRFAVFPIPGNPTTPESGAQVTFILNFFEELKRKVP